MFSDSYELREKILIEPVANGADSLRILSGYAANTMVSWHFGEIQERFGKNINIDLIIGMCGKDGLFKPVHEGFKNLMTFGQEGNESKLTCRYIIEGKPVHAKIYLWEKNGRPFTAFLGSANYSYQAFFGMQFEAMEECEADEACRYLDSVEPYTMYCTHPEIEDKILITKRHPKFAAVNEQAQEEELSPVSIEGLGVEKAVLSFISKRSGKTGKHSGINWGHRENRNRNEAYIPVPSDIANSGFFPPRKVPFLALTDDGKSLILSVGQDNGKGISTPHNNSLIGEYFRNRLGLANGAYVTREDFENYGRIDIVFYKLDDEQFFMDFSKP
ncbi:MAG: NgoFVII family restriction endonuclease [Synergistaceae bacterium]|nr:NgoFVII family restriction endonuclease [Synergistaceae bacterium]